MLEVGRWQRPLCPQILDGAFPDAQQGSDVTEGEHRGFIIRRLFA